MTQLFTYTIPYDDGAAPNPFHRMCTLAICKPSIRRVAKVGDWVAGLGSKNAPSGDLSGRLVYAMKVEEVIALSEYDRRAPQEWPHKIPDFRSADHNNRLGDCIYDYSAGEPPYQRLGVHSVQNRTVDLGGMNVLISTDYYYLGKLAAALPSNLMNICHQGVGHKSKANAGFVADFEYWIRGLGYPIGKYGSPDQVIDWTFTIAGGGCGARTVCKADDPVC